MARDPGFSAHNIIMDNDKMELTFDFGAPVQRQLGEHGFVLLPSFLSPVTLASLSDHCRRLVDSRVPGLGADRIISAHQVDRTLFELATHPKILDAVQKQIGPNILLW